MFSFRRIAAILAATGIAIAVAVQGTSSASAGTATVKYGCNVPGTGSLWPYDWWVTIDAPAVATHGQPITLNISMGVDSVNGPIVARSEGVGLSITLGGASTGTALGSPMRNAEIPAGSHLRFDGGTAQVTPTHTGNLTFTPGRFSWAFFSSDGTVVAGAICYPRIGFPLPVLATTRVI